MTSTKNALYSTEQHQVVSPSMTVWLMRLSKVFHSVELVPPVWAPTRVRRAFLLFLTLAPSTGRADRRKPSTLYGLLLDRKPAHVCWRRSRWSNATVANDAIQRLPWLNSDNRRPFNPRVAGW